MTEPSAKKGLDWWHYLIGVSCLVPVLGLLSSFISFILGIVKFKQGGWILILFCFLGLGSTLGSGYYFYYNVYSAKTGLMADARIQVTRQGLTQLVHDIEAYKLAHGQYPKALADLPQQARVHAYDPETMSGDIKAMQLYMYDVMPDGQTYYVFSRGPDGEAFTADDLFPQLDADELSRFGYRQRPGDFASLQSSPVPGSQVPAPAASSSLVWRTPTEGLQESIRTHKPILYDISAEWCGPCRRLLSDVFEDPQCAARINQSFIPVRVLDRRKEEGKNPQDIEDIEKKYQLEGFPTLVVQFPDRNDSRKLVGYYGKDGTMDFLNKSMQ